MLEDKNKNMITDKKYIERIFDSLNDKDVKEYLKKEKEIIDIKEKSKVVFLDFDGVLNTMNYLISVQRDIEEAMCEEKKWSSLQIDLEKVELLNRIIEKTNAVVIVSSAWRMGRSKQELQEILDMRGFKGKVVGVTPYLNGKARHYEILEVVNLLGDLLESYVVIDDSSRAGVPGHFIQTTMDMGLLEGHVEYAVRILKC